MGRRRADTIFRSLGGLFWGIYKARMLLANMLYGPGKNMFLKFCYIASFVADGSALSEWLLLYLHVA
jgi:hypothetical protein